VSKNLRLVIEGPEEVKWDLGFGCFCTWKMGLIYWDWDLLQKKAKMGMGIDVLLVQSVG